MHGAWSKSTNEGLEPYVEARREWNDRYLDLVRARRWWQVTAVAELLLMGVLSAGLVALSLQHKTVPPRRRGRHARGGHRGEARGRRGSPD
jgi:type IV secretion system protein TrbF